MVMGSFFNHTSVLLLGGFAISAAFSRCQLELRLAAYLQQIFGNNPWLYPFPIFCGSGKPVGDGITWETIQSMQERK